ncbi:hypothetical protein Tco_0818702 [Tanacetum coccineum]
MFNLTQVIPFSEHGLNPGYAKYMYWLRLYLCLSIDSTLVILNVIEIGSSSSELECLSTSELECSSTSESSSSDDSSSSELSSYVSSYDESSSSDESGCLEKSVPGLMKMTVSQKGPSKDLLNWYEDVNDQDEEEIDEDDDETDEQDVEIDEEAEDGKDDDDDELWSLKTIGTTTKKFTSPKMKGASSNSTPSTKKLVKSSKPIRNCLFMFKCF